MRTIAIPRIFSSIALFLAACAPVHRADLHLSRAPISSGELLRVTHASPCCKTPSIGVGQSLKGDTLVLQAYAGSERFAIPRSSITEIERWNRGRTHKVDGAIWGVLIGSASGGVMGYASGCSHCDGDMRPLTAMVGILFGGGLGLATGVIMGSFHHGFWEVVASP
ncbi:MAG: hypothetical protein ACJ77R_02945 [Gemmatimonadaceae bacterium]